MKIKMHSLMLSIFALISVFTVTRIVKAMEEEKSEEFMEQDIPNIGDMEPADIIYDCILCLKKFKLNQAVNDDDITQEHCTVLQQELKKRGLEGALAKKLQEEESDVWNALNVLQQRGSFGRVPTVSSLSSFGGWGGEEPKFSAKPTVPSSSECTTYKAEVVNLKSELERCQKEKKLEEEFLQKSKSELLTLGELEEKVKTSEKQQKEYEAQLQALKNPEISSFIQSMQKLNDIKTPLKQAHVLYKAISETKEDVAQLKSKAKSFNQTERLKVEQLIADFNHALVAYKKALVELLGEAKRGLNQFSQNLSGLSGDLKQLIEARAKHSRIFYEYLNKVASQEISPQVKPGFFARWFSLKQVQQQKEMTPEQEEAMKEITREVKKK